MKNNKILIKRVEKLLENKTNKFKRKYYLLSTLSATKINESEDLFSELDCYANLLFETNGQKPRESAIKDLVNRSFNNKSKTNYVENFINMRFPLEKSLTESILEESFENFKFDKDGVDNKLEETLIESIKRNINLLFEQSQEEDQEEYQEEELQDLEYEEDLELDHMLADKFAREEEAKENKLDLKSDKFVKGEKIARLSKADKYNIHLVRPYLEAQDNAIKRKYDILMQIHYYLFVQKQINTLDDYSKKLMDMDADTSSAKDIVSKYAKPRSNISAKKFNECINKFEKYWEYFLEEVARFSEKRDSVYDLRSNKLSSIMPESALIDLLFDSAGSAQEEKVDVYVSQLNSRTPAKQGENLEDKIEDTMPDEEYEGYQLDNIEFDKRQARGYEEEDVVNKEKFGDDYETDEEREERLVAAKNKSDDEIEINSKDFEFMTDKDFEELPDQFTVVVDRGDFQSTKKKKIKLYKELIDKAASPEEFQQYVEEYISGEVEPKSYADIARGSGSRWRDSAGARQAIIKSWFQGLFYSKDTKTLSRIYANVARKWFEAARLYDLIGDISFTLPAEFSKADEYGQGSMSPEGFDRIENILTNPKKLEKYFDMDLEDEDPTSFTLINGFLSDSSSLRNFVTSYLKDYYTNNVWGTIEKDLTKGVKEYFKRNYPNANVGYSLPANKKSDVLNNAEHKTIFNPIIYWTMLRTGIKDKKNRVPNAGQLESERKDYFIKKIPKVIEDSNAKGKAYAQEHRKDLAFNFMPLTMSSSDIEKLMNDCLSDTGIIGKHFAKARSKMSDESVDEFINWLDSKMPKELGLSIVQSLLTAYVERKKEDNTPEGNMVDQISPEIYKQIEKGTGMSPENYPAGSDARKAAEDALNKNSALKKKIAKDASLGKKGAPYFLEKYIQILGDSLRAHQEDVKDDYGY